MSDSGSPTRDREKLTWQPEPRAPIPQGVALRRLITGLRTSSWLRTLGAGAWLALGMAGVLALALFLIVLAVHLNEVAGDKTYSEVSGAYLALSS